MSIYTSIDPLEGIGNVSSRMTGNLSSRAARFNAPMVDFLGLKLIVVDFLEDRVTLAVP